jgi:hypothetical protein
MLKYIIQLKLSSVSWHAHVSSMVEVVISTVFQLNYLELSDRFQMITCLFMYAWVKSVPNLNQPDIRLFAHYQQVVHPQ